jgi:2-keto-3-deoxy-L-rhamnonate aldolase RhmA
MPNPKPTIHARLDLSTVCTGSWCQIGHPANAEILAQAGFAWVAADCEHGEVEDGDLGGFCRAVRQSACTPLVRVRENAVLPIRRALDLGAAGVIVPLVNSAAEAAAAVRAAHYPPKGIRGFAWQRGNAWGTAFDVYAADFDPIVVVMIESRAAVEDIDAIMAVDGVDGCFIGPYDLSGSYGIVGQTGHQLVVEACARVAEACRRSGKAAGQHIVVPTRERVHAAIAQGFTFLALGMDSQFLGRGAAQALEMLP